MAQQIAHQRGHTFDIESFLTPEQRVEYAALQGEEPPDLPSAGTSERSGEASGVSGISGGSGEGAGSEGIGTREREEDEVVGTPPAKRIKLGPNTPLSQVYWKQRLDRLARVRSRSFSPSSSPSASVHLPGHPSHLPPPSPARSREASPSPWARRELRDTPVHLRKLAPVTEADKVDIAASASYWNHLLCQARAARGPQYDYNTRQLLFDRQSEAYYTQGRPPREDTSPPELAPESASDAASAPPGSAGKDAGRPGSKDGSKVVGEKGEKGEKKEEKKEEKGDKDKSGTPKTNGDQPNGTPKSGPPPSPGPPHARLAAAQAAQANVQAQALALAGVGPGGGGPGQESPGGPGGPGMPPGMNPGMNPGMMMPQGVNPMALMGGGPPPQGPMVGGGQGPMLGGGWQDS